MLAATKAVAIASGVANIGILAHVDAGKTSLTERILYDAGVITTAGDVNHGTTQTDTMELERRRGITIRSAVVSFQLGTRKINLIDTPGHPDFIAEVERVIGVLDAVVLVISAVEGVQPQTRRLSRAITRLGLPCIIFVNKIDRAGARFSSLVDEISRELQRDLVVLSDITGLGEHCATSVPRDLSESAAMDDVLDALARHDDALLDRFVAADGNVEEADTRRVMKEQVEATVITPVIFGSAITGAGIGQLFNVLEELVPGATDDADAPLAAEVFKVQRLPNGERVLICRIWSGTMAVRSVVPIVRPDASPGDDIATAKITGIDRFHDGRTDSAPSASAGDIVRVHGLADARIGDWIGEMVRERVVAFEPPVFESRIDVIDPLQRVGLNAALVELADQDPLIGVRRNQANGETFVRLYGEVQKEVVEATLHDDYGLDVEFGEGTVLCVERLLGEGRAAEIFPDTQPPFYATVGFRIAPKRGDIATWSFTPGKAKQGFFDAAEAGGHSVLDQGLYGWPVIDWDVVVTDLIYLVSSVPVDYRRLAMLVMADAIRDAGTVVCEPVHDVTIRAPQDSVGAVIHALSVRRGVIGDTTLEGDIAVVSGMVPAAEVDALTRELPGLTNGRADIDARFRDYVPVTGDPPVRRRTDNNPFNRMEFMSRLSGRF